MTRRWLLVIPCALLACARAERKPAKDALEVACAAAGGRACRELGWKALRGPPSAASDRAAARLFMEGCETKDAQSCTDLGALYAAGRGVRQDDARACALGLADACERAGLPVPGAPAVPTERVAPGAGSEPASRSAKELEAAVDASARYARDRIPSDLHEPLGTTRAALEAEPPAPEDDLHLVRRLVALRRWAVSDCLPVYVYPNQHAAPAVAWVSFIIGADGRAASVRVAPVAATPDGAIGERCVIDAVARWEFPAPRVGGRLWMRFEGTGPRREVAFPSGRDGVPAFATAGFVKPRMAEEACVQKRVATSPKLDAAVRDPRFSRHLTVKFAVGPSGDASQFEVLGPKDAPAELARLVEQSIHACRWIPGTDPEGRAVPIWVILPMRFR